MQIQTRITGFEQKGDWFEFKTEAFKVSTKNREVAKEAHGLINQPVVLDYVEQESQKANPYTGLPYINRYLNGARLAGANEQGLEADPFGNPTSSAPATVTLDEVLTKVDGGSDERGQRMGRNQIAAAAVDVILQMGDGSPEFIQKTLDGLSRWSETGETVFVTAAAATTTPDDIPF